ncbi:hypothetical protein RHS01_03682 [Rhizoctonia solani]|uniref:Uncharacterized protein n=1 Tax=Rhizoctonia solani TaxID=456999 RepID=A0A8H7IE28_9AGAM|nr:hypothetical protein RHS01_03682 [Rhizoctonia solani]
MATRSRPPSQTRSPIDQGDLGPFLPSAAPVELGEVSLERVTRLLLGLLGQVERLEREVGEIKEAGIETRTNVENISQAVMLSRMGLEASSPTGHGPQRTQNLRLWKQRHAPYQKLNPIGLTSWVSFWPEIIQGAPYLCPAHASPSSAPAVPSPPPSPRLRSPIGAPAPPPPAPVAAYPAPVKVDHPDAYTGKIGSEAKQWLTRMLAWTRLNSRMFPTDQEVLSFLLMNMKDSAGAWAHPHLDQLGSHRAIIQTVKGAAERKITTLTQSGTCADYITKFRTLAMELDWNNAALRGQFARGLHWEQTIQPRKGDEYRPIHNRFEETLHNPNFVSEEERNRRRAAGACIKCGKMGHKFAECRTGWKATPIEERERLRKPPKLAKTPVPIGKRVRVPAAARKDPKDSGFIEICNISDKASGTPRSPDRLRRHIVIPSPTYRRGTTPTLIDLPTPRTVTMLDGSAPRLAKSGKRRLKWLDAHNPEIDWNSRTLSFPHAPPEHVAIAKEEEADQNPLEGVPPKYHQYAKSATLKDWLRDKLRAGKIRPSKSSISSPVMFVPKKDGSRRLVVDYRRLNNRTKKNVYPLPRPNDLMAQLRGAKVFTKLDLQWGYNNVWSLVMTFGLTNAPAAFQHFMNELFKDLLDVCVIIYLDDILIYSKDDATHTQHVHEVLRRLMENQLFCKASKCTFHVTSVEYLGIIVLDKGFSLDKLKIQAIQEWPTPTKVKEVQSFLGFANFLRRFVANFSHMARPLHNLVKKDTPWKWETKEQEAFQGLKDAITSAPVLCHANPTKPYFLENRRLGAALGSILSQRQEDGRLHPLGFLSESFKGAEQNYDTHDKELLAIIRSFEYWRIFLEGTTHPVTVFTDHRNLEYWKDRYNFQIAYRPGKQSGKPDALSRRADHADIPPAAQTMLPDPVFANVALNESRAPPSIKRAFKDYEMEAGLLFYQGRIVVPDVGTLRTDLLRIYHDSPLSGHPGRQRTLELISRVYYWPGIRANTYWHVDSCETCQRIRRPKYSSIPPQPLELPSRPWQHVSYDMIVDLPKDGNSDSILVIVDSFTKYVILVECSKKLKAPELADLFLRHVWKRYGMPEKTVLDRGRVFNNKFLKALDGQTERVNPTVEHFLRAYSGVNQKDWVKWLPMAEFAYNNAVHSSTGKSPFKALYGWEPSLTPSNVPTDVPEADNLATQMEAQWQEIEAALRQSKTRMVAGAVGEPLGFEIGEEAWLDAKNVKLKTLSPKLTEQRLGPFKITKKISDRAYRLELPPTMRIHNVFYVGLLSKVKRDKKRNFENRPPPVTVDGEEEYKVEGITDMEERNGKWFFRVKWKGYGSEENTWEPRENLKNAEKILEKFEREMKKKALGAAKALRGGAVS